MASLKKSKLTVQSSCNTGHDYRDNENSDISILNDDCLRHIFSYLSIKERIRIQRVCRRWKTLGQQPWHDFKKLDVVYKLFYDMEGRRVKDPAKTLKQILTFCGPCLTTVRLTARNLAFLTSTDMITLIAKLCPNIRCLDMGDLVLTSKTVKILTSTYTHLTTISIGNTWKDCEDTISVLFSQNKRLQSITISCSDVITGRCLSSLNPEFVELLEFGDNKKMSADHVIDVIQKFRNLRILKLRKFLGFRMMDKVNEILKRIPVKSSLEELELYNCSTSRAIPIDGIGSFVNLKKLTLYGESFLHNKILFHLADCCKRLTHVELSGSDRVTDKGLMSFIKGLKLEELTLMSLQKISDKSFSCNIDTLKMLTFFNCNKVTCKAFSAVVLSAKNLKRLEIRRCLNVDLKKLINDINNIKKVSDSTCLELFIHSKVDVRQIEDISPQLRIIKDPKLY